MASRPLSCRPTVPSTHCATADRFGQWLNTIVRRESIQLLRKNGREPRPLESGDLLSIVGGAWSASPGAPPEVLSSIRDALRVLSSRDRTVMTLHYLEGYTCAEIASNIGISPGGVKRILHNSRSKVREECTAMAESERKGPRRLSFWMSGEVPHGEWDAMAQLKPALAQAVCLSVNKRAKTIDQIADDVESHRDYVGDMVEGLAKLDVLTSPKKEHYLLNFIAFDSADWRRLFSGIRQPGAEIAQRLADGQPALTAAYDQTPLARAGWTWEDVAWVVNCLIIAQRRLARAVGHPQVLRPPTRPGGYPYWLGGLEYRPDSDIQLPDTPGWSGTERGGWGIGHFGPSMDHKGHTWMFAPPSHGRTLLYALLDGPLAEEPLLSRLNTEDREQYRSTLAKLVAQELVERRNDATFSLRFPVFSDGDSEILTPVVDEIVNPIIAEALTPAGDGLDQLLDEMGYGHRRDQYPVWRDWFYGFIMGEALRFMIKQGVLPELGENPPAKWSYAAWKGELPLFALA